MKTINEDIKTGQFRPAYLLYGEEAYLKVQYKNKLRAAILPEDDTMNLSVYTGKGIDVKQVIYQEETIHFFAENRLIMIWD
ncbi:MAG: DNA polymerase III subunit delta, partial [Clostridiales bacterium]|nr:DNA polymerase III subunit delta [Clostridiales bacterium]